MEYNKIKYDTNEQLVLTIALWLLGGSVGIFILSVLMIDNFDFLFGTFEIVTAIGAIASAAMVIVGNVRVLRYFLIIRKEDNKAYIWKSTLVMFLGLLSVFIYWITMLILFYQNF